MDTLLTQLATNLALEFLSLSLSRTFTLRSSTTSPLLAALKLGESEPSILNIEKHKNVAFEKSNYCLKSSLSKSLKWLENHSLTSALNNVKYNVTFIRQSIF